MYNHIFVRQTCIIVGLSLSSSIQPSFPPSFRGIEYDTIKEIMKQRNAKQDEKNLLCPSVYPPYQTRASKVRGIECPIKKRKRMSLILILTPMIDT